MDGEPSRKTREATLPDKDPKPLSRAERKAFDQIVARAEEYARAYYGDDAPVKEGDWQIIQTSVGDITVGALEVFDDGIPPVRRFGLYIVFDATKAPLVRGPRNTYDVSDALHRELVEKLGHARESIRQYRERQEQGA